MDFNNTVLTSVYPHDCGDSCSASDSLMNSISNQAQGQLVRISPNAFIYMTIEPNDDGVDCPTCHMVVSTDTDHYVGGIGADTSPAEDDTDDGSMIMPLDDVAPYDPDGDGDDDSSDDTNQDTDQDIASGVIPAPTDLSSSMVVSPEPNDDIAGVLDTPIVTTLAPAVDVVNDQNDMLNSELDEAKCNDEKDKGCKDSKLDETAYVEYPHTNTNLDEAIQQISTALTNRYGGSITLHEGHCLTHVRKDGLVDRVTAVDGKYMIRTHKLK